MKFVLVFISVLFIFSRAEGLITDNITTIYLVSSCHLDVGFANTAQNIVNEYFDKYFPDAIKIANELRDLGGEERLVFTTHPYLVYLYTHCSVAAKLGLHCPTPTQLAQFTDAVKRGDITWHAFPFNSQMEFYDSTMADFGFNLTHTLDAMFGRKPTITMSQRDVPGTTRSIIPIMNRNGVKALTVGVNTATMPPAVPSIFRWKDSVSGEEVVGMWHPHGYGGQHGPSAEDIVTVPGLNEVLAFAIRGDNSGPPPALEVMKNYKTLKGLFPDAKIIASGYDEFVERVLTVVDKLPVHTQEIGDTWIHGISSDPYKTAASRAAMRLFSQCIGGPKCPLDEAQIVNFAALFLKNGEHTWGKDVKKFLHDEQNWLNSQFHSKLTESNFKDMINSWVEQREWGLNNALGMLGFGNYLKSAIIEELEWLRFNGTIDTKSFKQIDLSSQTTCGNFKIGFSSKAASINHLSYKNTQMLATDSNPLAQVIYETYTAEDFKTFLDEYVYDFGQGYIFKDLGKPGLNIKEKFTVSPTGKSLWSKEDENSCTLLLESVFDTKLVQEFGAPQSVWTQIDIPKNNQLSNISMILYLVNKTATRIPESLSLYFNPAGVDPNTMTMSKLGEYISVLDVVKNGSKHLHACDEGGIAYKDHSLMVQSSDVALVCVGYPTPFPVPMETPDVSKGFSFNIVNNIWGTNYIMWYPYLAEEKSTKYRFSLNVAA